MSERIYVIPENVRGLGNIVGEKSVDDFERYLSNLVANSEVVNAETVTVFTLEVNAYSVRLTVPDSSVSYGSDIVCNAVLTDSNGDAVSGASVTFYRDGVSVGTASTDSSGLATYTMSNLAVGSYSVYAYYTDGEVSATSTTVSVNVVRLIPDISLTGSVSGTTVSLSGVLSVGTGYSVDIYQDGTVVDTVTTTTDGAFSSTISNLSEGVYSFYAMFNGNTNYTNVTSSTIGLSVGADPVLTLTVTGDSFGTYSSDSFTYDGNVLVDYGDGSTETYDGSRLSHTYSSSGTYTVNVYGDITALNNGCFSGQSNITSVVIVDNITSLGDYCFSGCYGLTSVDLGSVTSLGWGCFDTCTGLTSVNLGNNVTSLGGSCFNHCYGLTSLTIPASVSSIGSDCLYNASNLTTLYLYWTDSDAIITYDTSDWLYGASVTSFSIPNGTTSKYRNKSYPLVMLTERSSTQTVTTVNLTSSSASITTLESATLTATVLDQNNDPMSGETVTFYDSSTSLGTATTNSSGVATYTFTGSSGSHTLKATCETINSSNVTVTVSKVTPTLSITRSSASVNVGSTYTISGTLSAGTGQSVKIYEDNVLLDTVTTSTGGAYTKTITSTSSGSKTYYAVFDSTSTYETVTSSSVSVTINKITPTISISTSSSSVIVGNTYTISGTLSAGSGLSVKIYQGSTLLDTVTTGSNGTYSKTITASTAGTYTYHTVFDGNTQYDTVTSSNVSVSVTQAVTVDSVTLTGTSQILSYADSDTLTLTATVYDNDSNPMSGQTVTFYKGSTSMGTATTNSNGIATKTYSSTGAGDVSFSAECGSISSETYAVEDCYAYVTSFSNWSSVTNKGTTYVFSPFTVPDDHRIELKFSSTTGTRIAIGDTSHTNSSGYLEWIYAWYFDTSRMYTRNSGNGEVTNNLSYTKSTSSVYAIEYEGTALTMYKDGSQFKTLTSYDTLSLTRLIRLTRNTTGYISYIKVKAL